MQCHFFRVCQTTLFTLVFLLLSIARTQFAQAQVILKWTDEQILRAVEPMRAGRKLTPSVWPNGAKVAVCISWDVDNESVALSSGDTSPIKLSWGEYGAKEGLRRILSLHDKYQIPGSFFIPAVAALLAPEMVEEFKKRPQHEVGIHGWIHEGLQELSGREQEKELLLRAIHFWERSLGKRPVGYRAPNWAFSRYTLQLIRDAGFEYDSSAMSMSEPYEIAANARPTGLVELPISWILDDAPYLWLPGGAMPSPESVFKLFADDFDRAYDEGTLFVLTMHPMITGRRSYLPYLEKLILHMKSKPDVWFATGKQIAEYVKAQNAMAPNRTIEKASH